MAHFPGREKMRNFLVVISFLVLVFFGVAFAAPTEEEPCSFGEDISLEELDLPGIPLFMDPHGILQDAVNYLYLGGRGRDFGIMLDLDTVQSLSLLSYQTPSRGCGDAWAKMAAVRVYQERGGWNHDAVNLGSGSIHEVIDTMSSLHALDYLEFHAVGVVNGDVFEDVPRHDKEFDGFAILSLDGDFYRVNITRWTLALVLSDREKRGFHLSYFLVYYDEVMGAPPASRTGGNVPSEILRELFPDVIISPGEGKVSTTWGAIKSSR